MTLKVFRGNFDKIAETYRERDIGSELITVIGKITDCKELTQQGSSGEVADVCTALEKLRDAERQEGRQERDMELVAEWTKDGYSLEMIAKLLKKPEGFIRKLQEVSGAQAK